MWMIRFMVSVNIRSIFVGLKMRIFIVFDKDHFFDVVTSCVGLTTIFLTTSTPRTTTPHSAVHAQ